MRKTLKSWLNTLGPAFAQAKEKPDPLQINLKRIQPLTRWSGRQDLNLRPPGPEGEKDESHGVSECSFGSQSVETIQEQPPPILDPVAENGSVETPFGAPVVRDLP